MNSVLTCKKHGLYPIMTLFFYKAASRLLVILFLTTVFVFPQNEAHAAITVAQVTQAATSIAATTQTTAAFTPVADTLYLMWTIQTIGFGFGPPTVPTVACANGLTMVQVNTVTFGTTVTPLKRLTLFRAMKPSGLSNNTCTITWGQTATGQGHVIVAYTGADASGTDGSGAVAQSVTGRTDNATAAAGLSITLAALQTGSTTAGGFSNSINVATALTAGTGYTPGTLVRFATPNTALLAEWDLTGTTTVNMTQSATSNIGGIAVEVQQPATVIADGAAPSNVTIAPSAAITDLDYFTLATTGGTDTVTAVTVTLGPAGAFNNIAQVDLTDNSNLARCTAVTNPASNTISFTTCTSNGGIPVTTTATTYKVRITPKTHAAMPPPAVGQSYATTGTVTAYTSANVRKTGTDSTSAIVTVDNLSPNGATAVSETAGDLQVTLNWTTSASTDFSRSVVLRWTGATASTEVPAEGTDYVNGNTITTATVVCVRTADAVSTAVSGVDGAGVGGCSATALASGQAYTYKIFQKDSNGNYDVGVPMGTVTTLPRVVSINCPVSCAATSAATVSWTVTFSTSVTGVDASAFALAASGLSGAYITTVTGSGTTWTVTANTGIGAGTLGLNQTGPGSVVPTLSGTFTGQVYTISATPALAEYRMDEASWNGTANEVVDSSGSGNSAQSFNSASTDGTTPAIAGSPGTCRYGVFDNGATITAGYVQTPLPNLTTDFTVTAWIRSTNNTIAGQRILIDDQNNTGGYGISLGDGSAGKIRFYSRGITPVILDSTYTIANNTWYFVAAAADITNKKRTIYVFNSAGALLNSTSEAAWTGGAWGTDAGPVSIGAEVNGPPQTELPASFHFKGNLDEVRVYQKVLNQNALAAIATQTHVCPIIAPDHLVIQSSGSGLTCAASTLTVVACQDVACGIPYTGGVSGTLSATGTPTVNWDGTTGGAAGAGFVIPNGSSSVTKNVQVATAGSVVFDVSSATPAPTNATTCNFGSPTCTFTANTAGFIFSDTSSPGNSYTIFPQVSGIATPALYLRAVQASTTNPAVCTPAIINSTTSVNMGYTCNNPAACQPGNLATINATAIAPAGTAVSLPFDANGSAPITARYDDAGQITLNSSATVTPFGGGTAITLSGNSNAFVVAPYQFVFSGTTAAPIKAGNNFSTTVTAYNGLATPTATPNFGKETTPEGVTLTFSKCQPTGTSSSNGAFSGSTGSFASGVANATNLNWSEVGNGDLVATLTSGSYLGSGLTATGNTGTGGTVCNGGGAGNVGRFMPDHFDTVVTPGMQCPTGLTCPTVILANDQGFVYSGQPFTTNVYARNAADGTTANYDGTANTSPNFAKPVTLTAWDAPGSTTTNNPPAAPPGSSLGNGVIAAASFSQGTTFLGTPATPIYTFGTTPTSPTDIYIRAADADATSLRVPANTSVEGGIKVVSGRIRISNALGSELLQLPIALTAQYYNATSGWITSSTDSSSSFVVATPPATSAVNFGNFQQNLTAISVVGSPQTVTLSSGAGGYTLAAPGSGNKGSVDMSIPAVTGASCLVAPIPLGCYLPSSTARATFGVYKGASEFIYLRENY